MHILRNVLRYIGIILIIYLLTMVVLFRYYADQLIWKKRPSNHDGEVKRFTPRVVCWVPIQAGELEKKGKTIRSTWGDKCDQFLFITSVADGALGAVKLDVLPDNFRFLTQKCIKALLYLYDHHLQDGDWFLKADDDTYVIVENLRYLLSFYDPDEPWMTGHHLRVPKPGMGKGYFSGGAGHVMSRATLKRFVEDGIGKKKCRYDHRLYTAEDLYFGLCMRNLSVKFASSYDITNRETFHTMQFLEEFSGRHINWLERYHSHKKNIKCCSRYSITFHRLKHPTQMLEMHARLYFLKVWDGIQDPMYKTIDWFHPKEIDIDDI